VMSIWDTYDIRRDTKETAVVEVVVVVILVEVVVVVVAVKNSSFVDAVIIVYQWL